LIEWYWKSRKRKDNGRKPTRNYDVWGTHKGNVNTRTLKGEGLIG
jgi:hypothetical protein